MSIFLETKRLILKTPELSDLDNLIALRSDPEVMKYTGDDIQGKEEVKEVLDFFISYYAKHGIGFFSVFEKETNSFVGQAGLFHLLFDDTQPEIEIAYRLHKKFWGKGYATELAKAIIQWGFQNLSKDKLIASAYPDNVSSQKVLKKSGLDFIRKIILDDGTELFRYEIYKNDSIELVSYDNQWPILATLEMKALLDILPKNNLIDIQHVGSTAIPGMLAKPILDIQIAVDSINSIKKIAIDKLKKLGYEYWYENPDPERMFFVKGMPPFGERRTHHVHIVESTSRHWFGKIAFRDYLLSHPEAVREYEQLKIELAKQHTFDREEYTHGKTQLVNNILQKYKVWMTVKSTVETVNLLETKRLIVKPTSFDNVENVYALFSDPEVMRYVGRGVKSRSETEENLEKMIKHEEKHGFSFGDVYEKDTGLFVGRAGLAYLAMNDDQPDIEVGYALHKQFWKKGYATELARAFIDWGFKHLPVNKLVAVIRPENEESRRVLEKSGMHYVGRVNCYDSEGARYEVFKNKIDYEKIYLIPATIQDYATIQNMGRFYVYDISEYMGNEEGWEIPENGLHECIDFKKYWNDKNSFPFLVRYKNEIAGFAIIDKKGSDLTIDFNMAQFFILRKFKNKGMARYVAHQCFNNFPGVWEVMVIPGNEGAYRFWRSIIKKYTDNNFIEYTKNIAHFNNSRKNIFKFNTKNLDK